jgi:S-adenosylmethionine:tRNA ribosyltransferase-isomerase
MHPKDIKISDYTYHLPEERIAQHPVKIRDESKLLLAQTDSIKEDIFKHLHQYLPTDSLMVFNDTRVFHARLPFVKSTGAKIEVFLLNPLRPSPIIEEGFSVKGECIWLCFVGNKKKWKESSLEAKLEWKGEVLHLSAQYIKAQGNAHEIKFTWNDHITFGEIVEAFGKIPLPPYMNRDNQTEDAERYQTVYARKQGSVAAPTAGLHFTQKVFEKLKEKGINKDFVTLDVGAGTFKPVSAEQMEGHEMHREKVYIQRETIENILTSSGKKKIIAVGTTTTRTLESLYWYGVLLQQNPKALFNVQQWDPYNPDLPSLSREEALNNVLKYMKLNGLDLLHGQTQLIIAPGYSFHIVDILITNFHQPQSTLLLLVAAFYGQDWRKVYEYALKHDFRFLSYGDSCLFFRK